jgi:nitroreductase/FMN reductase [NAD(P)H]
MDESEDARVDESLKFRDDSSESFDASHKLKILLTQRFGDSFPWPEGQLSSDQTQALSALASRASHRQWSERSVDPDLLRMLVAVALCAPSKSDLQQAEFIEVRSPAQRAAVQALVPSMPWIAQAPVLLVTCGTGARFRRAFERAGQPFVNEHLDGVFNPTTDAAMVLMHLLVAAGSAGLVGVPISVLRDRADELAAILSLPAHVFPVAGVCLGYPSSSRSATPRFSLSASLHVDRHGGAGAALDVALDEFDSRYQAFRQAHLPEGAPRAGTWSQDKTKQYSQAQRADWGAFLNGRGFDFR